MYARDGRDPDQGLPLESVDSLNAVAETTVEMDWPVTVPTYTSTIATNSAVSKIYSISRRLILFFDGIVKVKTMEPQLGDLPEIIEPASFSQPRWAQKLHTKYHNPLVVGVEELEKFKHSFWDYESSEKPNFLQRAIYRFRVASDMAGEWVNVDYRLVDYIRSLEALLGGGAEIAHTLALRTAALLGGSPAERHDTYDFIRAAYNCRNKSVHGDSIPHLKFGRWTGVTLRGLRLFEEIDILHWYCRRSLQRVVELVSEINKKEGVANKWKQMSAAVWRDMKREEREKRSIVAMLDCSLLRKDFAETLEAFYNRSLDADTLCTEYGRCLQSSCNSIYKFLKQ
jgi:hypothetical protein